MVLYPWMVFVYQFLLDYYFQVHVVPKYEEQLNLKLKKVLDNEV